MSQSNSINVSHPRYDHQDDDDEKYEKTISKRGTIAEMVHDLGEAICSVGERFLWAPQYRKLYPEVFTKAFEFDDESMLVTLISGDIKTTYRLDLVEASSSPVVVNTTLTPVNSSIAGLLVLLISEIAYILTEFLWYDDGGEYEDILGYGFGFNEEDLVVTIEGSDGIAVYEPKLVRVNEGENE